VVRFLVAAVCATTALTGCSAPAHQVLEADLTATGALAQARTPDTFRVGQPSTDWAVADHGPLRGQLLTADLLVMGDKTLPNTLRARVGRLDGVRAAVPLSLASVPVDGRTLTVAAAEPASYRRFTPERTARTDALWQRVAAGELAITEEAATALGQPLGETIALGPFDRTVSLRVGAYASTVPKIDAVVNPRRGEQLGIVKDNAILVSLDSPEDLAGTAASLERVVGRPAAVQALHGIGSDGTAGAGAGAAVLTGGSVARAVGSFRYRYFTDGTVAPDPRWVSVNIRTATVPLLGRVTCHRALFPQLRSALQEVVDAGLADSIDASEYGGCYVPRFIGHDPQRGLSLHTWGIAVDLNVPGNMRGTVGEMDRDVVAIFKEWGFAWGGDWQYTDPMHFELAALLPPRH
jgi:hypothetical protein